MNGIENIKAKILDEANAEAKATLDEAQTKANALSADAKEAVEKEKAALLEKGQKIAEESHRRIVAATDLEQRKAVLKLKQETIAKAFEQASAKIDAISGKEYEDLLVRLIVKNSSTGKEEVEFAEADKAIAENVIAQANEQLKGKLTVSEKPAKFDKGVLLRDGSVEVNCSLATLVGYMKEELTAEVAKLLFE